MNNIILFIVKPKQFISTDCFESFYIKEGNAHPSPELLYEKAGLLLGEKIDNFNWTIETIRFNNLKDLKEVYVDLDSRDDAWVVAGKLKKAINNLNHSGWKYKQNTDLNSRVLYKGYNAGLDRYSSIKQSILIK